MAGLQETADDYPRLVTELCAGWRVVVCRDGIQWILQRREKGAATRPWRPTTKKALIRLCGELELPVEPNAAELLDALPERTGEFPQLSREAA